jgi:hypothetical protein
LSADDAPRVVSTANRQALGEKALGEKALGERALGELMRGGGHGGAVRGRPSLSSSSPIDKKIKLQMMQSALNIVGFVPTDRKAHKKARERAFLLMRRA